MTEHEQFINEYCRNVAHEPLTNEEWFCGLSTEEKADLMSRIVGCSNCPIPKDGRSCMGTYSGCWHEIIKWLKQPHTEKEQHDDRVMQKTDNINRLGVE